jgi:hypothetical protein
MGDIPATMADRTMWGITSRYMNKKAYKVASWEATTNVIVI